MTINEAIDRAFGKSAYSSSGQPTKDAFVLATEVERLRKESDVHYKSSCYYYLKLIAIAKSLGRLDVDDDMPITGMDVEVAKLKDLHRPRDTRKGEWPEAGQMIHRWDGEEGGWNVYHGKHEDCWNNHIYWLPAPPSPEGD